MLTFYQEFVVCFTFILLSLSGYLIHTSSSAGCKSTGSSKVCPQTPSHHPLLKHIYPATQFWTATNIADGLNALATTVEVSWLPTPCSASHKLYCCRWCSSRYLCSGHIAPLSTQIPLWVQQTFSDRSGIGTSIPSRQAIVSCLLNPPYLQHKLL